ncbi:hypothetical protein [Pseudoalteromonas carrageenovora]|nr:hypothetical protein [Pseudoalteromonas carrageenovora]MDO6463227.1 hypothetical protein [Pseudoalteromonas carrageenovora]MDO6545987.1 hypothetical protein [Pseudoalteromonas carrageenovora]MDO6831229.1 hypothetical protein [Pseudoalteromonas carrageenovora]MDO6835884.1 hypothetical protein [Pseudoalteromonas carrageenovora]
MLDTAAGSSVLDKASLND